MSRIKTNVITILAAVAVSLLVAAAVFFALWRIGAADLRAAETKAEDAVQASQDNATKLKALQTDYNQLVERRRLDTAAALRAAADHRAAAEIARPDRPFEPSPGATSP